jgi:8-oxo-dGTP pyrophosphatase MutT (NUDIX family)
MPHHPTQHIDPRILADISEDTALRAAAVLIAVSRPTSSEASRVVLTLRSEKLSSHAGQVSLPGGSCDEQDCDAVATALREAEEEIGLAREEVEVIGQMSEIALPSGFKITPVVGLINSGIALTPCPREVAAIFHPPLDLLLDPDAYSRSTAYYRGADRTILEMPYEGYRIWGATAAILYYLAKQIRA